MGWFTKKSPKSELTLAIEKYKAENKALPLMLRLFDESGDKPLNPYKYFDFYDEENLLPEEFERALKGELNVFADYRMS